MKIFYNERLNKLYVKSDDGLTYKEIRDIGKNQKHALIFYCKYVKHGYTSYSRACKVTVKALKGLHKKGYAFMHPEYNMFMVNM